VHLTGADCGAVASRVGAKSLVLTHIPPWHDREVALREASELYDGPVELARVGAVYDL
jgi:ribonuclease BN (tRNA processing enzyme)